MNKSIEKFLIIGLGAWIILFGLAKFGEKSSLLRMYTTKTFEDEVYVKAATCHPAFTPSHCEKESESKLVYKNVYGGLSEKNLDTITMYLDDEKSSVTAVTITLKPDTLMGGYRKKIKDSL